MVARSEFGTLIMTVERSDLASGCVRDAFGTYYLSGQIRLELHRKARLTHVSKDL